MRNAKVKKYAQLVEVPTPEPQQIDEDTNYDDDDEAPTREQSDTSMGGSSGPPPMPPAGLNNSAQSAESFKIEMSPAPPQEHCQLVASKTNIEEKSNDRPNNARKESQCSQASTIFPSTSSEISDAQLTCSSLAAAPGTINSPRGGADKDDDGSAGCERTSSARNLKRASISRSMLELDRTASKRVNRFQVQWSNLSFSYGGSLLANLSATAARKRASQRHVLRNLSGRFRSNQLIAIIGPSGCGKTTLLQFLAGNNPSQSDRLTISGLEEPKVAFIGQDDCLLPGLTARETLIYASRLQNTKAGFDHEQHIRPILAELGLLECADRSVTKLSGGQVKRVTIAQELLYPTNLLILDEVTSGLDASTSYSIVKLLKQLVSDQHYPMSIVMSIHQPSARLFSVFDQVYVMSEGYCLYEGSCQVDLVNAYLGRFNLECPKFHNIADYLIEIASDDLSPNQSIKQQLIQYQRKQSQLSSQPSTMEQHIVKTHVVTTTTEANDADDADEDELQSQGISMLLMTADHEDANCANGANGSPASATSETPPPPPSYSLFAAIERARSQRDRPIGTHLVVHLSRSLLRIRRSYILTYLQFITYILLGLQLSTFYGPDIGTLSGCPKLPLSFMAFVFSNDDTDNVSVEMRRIQENMNFLLVAIMTATFAALEITVITFPLEAKTVKREWRNGWYRVSSYFMGRTLADLPFQVAFIIAFCAVIYTLTGQIGLTTWRFGSFILIIIMTALVAQTVGFIFGAIFMDNLPAAVFTAPLCIFPALLFSGFFSRVSQIPSFYKPMTYLSHFRYAFDALLVTLYGYDRCNCDQEALHAYHASLDNQTSTMRTMFKSLFGSSDCAPSGSNSNENSIEDVTSMTPPLLSLSSDSNTTTTIVPKIHTLEDALVDGLFEHMKNTSATDSATTTSAGGEGESAMDHLAYKFSNRVTSMLNSRSNFGHEIPKECSQFNSYLMTEFDLRNDDLLFGLAMLLVVVILSRILCNTILSFTIATRTT